ncbi:DUF4132 domain-containing protein [bacterium]|nr:DUF4132 domain-containing protein [bacterium]
MAKRSRPIPDAMADLAAWLIESVSTKNLEKYLDPQMFPPISFRDGTEAPVGPIIALWKSTRPQDDAIYGAIRDRLDPTSMRPLAESVARWWVEGGSPTRHRWVIPPLAEWGNDATMVLVGQWLRDWVKKKKRVQSQLAVDLLSQVASPSALHDLDEIAHGKGTPAFVEMARSAFCQAAQTKGITVEDLADQVIPTLELDSHGSRTFAEGNRSVRAQLKPGGSFELRNEAGKVVRSLPKASGESPGEISPSDWLKQAKKRLKDLHTHQAGRLERAMIARREWPAAAWQSLFLSHPIMRTIAPSLLWAFCDLPNNKTMFRVAEDYSLADQGDGEISLPADSRVEIPHPIDLDTETSAGWKQLFSDYAIQQPFMQLAREVNRLDPNELAGATISRYIGTSVDHRVLKGTLKRKGWLPAPAFEGGMSVYHHKHFEVWNVTAVLFHDPVFLGGDYGSAEGVPLGIVAFIQGEFDRREGLDLRQYPTIALAKVSPVVISETLRDVDRLRPSSAE